MTDPAWLMHDISADVTPPDISTCEARSPEALERIVAQFRVRTAERYKVRDIDKNGRKDTFCNIFVSDVTRALEAEIPHNVGGIWQDVRRNAKWLRDDESHNWGSCTAEQAQAAADAGRPAVVVWDPSYATGHIALVVPSHGSPGVWIAQAGASNFERAPLSRGFGNAKPLEYFCHP